MRCREKRPTDNKGCDERKRRKKKDKNKKRGEDRDFCFAPLRTSCVPGHVKIDTETMAQIFVPYREAVDATDDRKEYNDWVHT